MSCLPTTFDLLIKMDGRQCSGCIIVNQIKYGSLGGLRAADEGLSWVAFIHLMGFFAPRQLLYPCWTTIFQVARGCRLDVDHVVIQLTATIK